MAERKEKTERMRFASLALPLLFIFFLVQPSSAQSPSWKESFIRKLKNGGAYVENDSGKILFSYQAEKTFIPASTIKVATAYCALRHFGRDYRFATDFFVDPQQRLVVQGFGDPALLSEELQLIAKEIARRKKRFRGIVLDSSYFSPSIFIDGAGSSSNPYDAVNGALVANFNSVQLRKFRNGRIESAEAQTPLSPLALQIGKTIPLGDTRVNLGQDEDKGERYLGELLHIFLQQQGVELAGNIELGRLSTAKSFYRHYGTKNLEELVRLMLKHSNNFMANQLFLVLGAKQFGAPATVAKAKTALRDCLRNEIGLQQFEVEDGAGLSRKNAFSAHSLVRVLRAFDPYRALLPLEEGQYYAKTGTLKGVNTLVGFFYTKDGHLVRFSFLVNSPVPFEHKFKLGREIYRAFGAGSGSEKNLK